MRSSVLFAGLPARTGAAGAGWQRELSAVQAPETLGDALRQRGIVLRSCGNYPGLDGSWYRTAVRTAPENQQLLKTLQEVLA